jgi:hypothetical protein
MMRFPAYVTSAQSHARLSGSLKKTLEATEKLVPAAGFELATPRRLSPPTLRAKSRHQSQCGESLKL